MLSAGAAARLLVRVRWPEASLGKLSFLCLPLLMGAALGDLDFGRFLTLMLLLSVLGLFGYLVNDWVDRTDDLAVGKPNAYAGVSRTTGFLTLSAILLAAVVLTWAACRSSMLATALVGMQLATSFAYSHPPFRLKGRGAAGLVAVMVAQYLLPMALVLSSCASLGVIDWVFFLSFILVNGLCLEIGHQRADRDRDRSVSLRSFATARTPESLECWYRRLLFVLAGFLFALPFYVLSRLALAPPVSPWAAVIGLGIVYVTAALAQAVGDRLAGKGSALFDPFYASEGNVLDRLYTYFPNGFLLLALALLPAVVTDWRFAVFAVVWVGLSMPTRSPASHVRELVHLFRPPELR